MGLGTVLHLRHTSTNLPPTTSSFLSLSSVGILITLDSKYSANLFWFHMFCKGHHVRGCHNFTLYLSYNSTLREARLFAEKASMYSGYSSE